MRKAASIIKSHFTRIVILAVMTTVTISFHYRGMDQSDMVLRGLFRQFCYLPILLSAFWFGLRGGMAGAAVIVAAVSPMLFNSDMGSSGLAQEVLEYTYYFLFGGVFGYLVDREREAQRKREELVRRVSKMEHMSAIGELAAGLAHEIKNPMGSIKGAAQILEPEIPEENPKHEFMGILIEEVDRLNRVVEQFLQYAKPLKLNPEEVDLNSLLQSVLQQVKLEAPQITTKLEPGGGEKINVKVDRDLIRQVFLNLCLNAAQAMRGKGELTVEEKKADEGMEIYFHDTGPGLDPGAREKIFMPFHTTKDKGSGLGLTLSERIIIEHGGTILALDSPKGGALFKVTLPRGSD